MKFWAIKYMDKHPIWNGREYVPSKNPDDLGRPWEERFYSSTNNGASLFTTKGKASARLKTHFGGQWGEVQEAKVVCVELVEVEENA